MYLGAKNLYQLVLCKLLHSMEITSSSMLMYGVFLLMRSLGGDLFSVFIGFASGIIFFESNFKG